MVGEGFQGSLSIRGGGVAMIGLVESTLAQVPGFVIGISLGGKREVLAYGDRQVFGVDSPLPMERQTIFDLGSVTKVLATTAAIMRLLENETFSLDDKVSKFLGDWAGTDKDGITVRELLLHRSGLWEWRPLYVHAQDPRIAIQKISEIPLRYKVNEGRHYSDLGFISLGQVLNKISDENLSESVEELVLKPLQLNSTQFALPVSGTSVAATSFGDSIEREMIRSKVPYPVPEDATDFGNWREQVLVGEINDGNAFHVFGGISSHAGLFSSATDLLTFGEVMNASTKGDGQFSQRIANEFLSAGPDLGQHLGFRSWTDTNRGCTTEFFGHTGFPGTALAFSPSHDCVVVLLTNRLHTHGIPTPVESLLKSFLTSTHQKLHSA